jgi:phosphoribosylamine--glycine ligase
MKQVNTKYNVLILGSGAREHTFAWKIAQSKLLNKLYIAPGNAGTSKSGINLDINPLDFELVKDAIIKYKINILLVGSEEPIVKGINDYLSHHPKTKKCWIVAPPLEGAKLEGSKSWAKQFMLKYNIPTAKYHIVTKSNSQEGIAFLSTFSPPYVLKADGLASGKGVLIINDFNEACSALEEMLNGKFGIASETVVIEQFLKGVEVSFFILTDGEKYVILPEAKDYKRIGENDTGLNTGGMGAVSPVSFISETLRNKIKNLVIHRTVYGLVREKVDYKGFIFFGLVICDDQPYVIEYNARMGDPESEVIIPRVKNDMLELFEKLFTGKLEDCQIQTNPDFYTGVVAASKGYPEKFEKGKIIYGLDEVDSLVFHAGTSLLNNNVISNGGRVLVVSGNGKTVKEALAKSYKALETVTFDNVYFRRDIGYEF